MYYWRTTGDRSEIARFPELLVWIHKRLLFSLNGLADDPEIILNARTFYFGWLEFKSVIPSSSLLAILPQSD